MKSTCIDCGTIIDHGTRCDTCRRADGRHRIHHRGGTKPPAHARGYDSRWARLSRRARQLQPFCSDCGATTDLQADHSPEAWDRHSRGLPVRLQDIDVVCGPCNRRRGAARGPGAEQRRTNQDAHRSVQTPQPVQEDQ